MSSRRQHDGRTDAAGRPAGRVWLAAAAIVLFAASLRIAVGSFSPLVPRIGEDIEIPDVVVGLIGAAPPVGYAIFGILTPALVRRLRLETVAVGVVVVTAAGLVARSLAGDALGLLAFTFVAFAAVGVGNVLMPGLVKRYFPDRIGVLTSVYTSTMALATIVPPLVGVPLADAAGWRLALGVWAAVAVVAVVPWIALAARAGAPGDEAEADRPGSVRRLLSLPRTWGLVVAMVVASATAYTAFAWLPTLLAEQAGVGPADAGVLLAVFGATGLPLSVLAPLVVVRLGRVRTLFAATVVPGLVGAAGLVVAPAAAPTAWVVLLALPTALFPVVFTLVGLATRTHVTTVALSGAVQSIGYGLTAVFPLAVGALRQATGGWTASVLLLAAMIAAGLVAMVLVARPGTVEDDWEARTGRTW